MRGTRIKRSTLSSIGQESLDRYRSIVASLQMHDFSLSPRYPQGHGLRAPMSTNFAG